MKSASSFKTAWYWAETLGGEHCFLAVGFGLGPRIAGELLASQLNLQLNSWQPSRTFPETKRYSSLINFGVGNPPLGTRTVGVRILLDCLGWLRDEPLQGQLDHDYVFYEAFFPTRVQLLDSHPNAKEIQPLIDPLSRTIHKTTCKRSPESAGHCLVSFGGIGTPCSTRVHTTEMPAAFLRWLASQRECLGKAEIVFCAPEPYCGEIRAELGASLDGIRFVSPSRREFLGLLERAEMYIVQPGLYGPFEGYLRGLRVILAPPMSYTQFKQAQAFRTQGFITEVPTVDGLEAYVGDVGDSIHHDEPAFFDAISAWWVDYVSRAERDPLFEGWRKSLLLILEDAELGRTRQELVSESLANLPSAAAILAQEHIFKAS